MKLIITITMTPLKHLFIVWMVYSLALDVKCQRREQHYKITTGPSKLPRLLTGFQAYSTESQTNSHTNDKTNTFIQHSSDAIQTGSSTQHVTSYMSEMTSTYSESTRAMTTSTNVAAASESPNLTLSVGTSQRSTPIKVSPNSSTKLPSFSLSTRLTNTSRGKVTRSTISSSLQTFSSQINYKTTKEMVSPTTESYESYSPYVKTEASRNSVTRRQRTTPMSSEGTEATSFQFSTNEKFKSTSVTQRRTSPKIVTSETTDNITSESSFTEVENVTDSEVMSSSPSTVNTTVAEVTDDVYFLSTQSPEVTSLSIPNHFVLAKKDIKYVALGAAWGFIFIVFVIIVIIVRRRHKAKRCKIVLDDKDPETLGATFSMARAEMMVLEDTSNRDKDSNARYPMFLEKGPLREQRQLTA